MNFERAMALMKEVLLERGHAINSQDAPGASLNGYNIHLYMVIIWGMNTTFPLLWR